MPFFHSTILAKVFHARLRICAYSKSNKYKEKRTYRKPLLIIRKVFQSGKNRKPTVTPVHPICGNINANDATKYAFVPAQSYPNQRGVIRLSSMEKIAVQAHATAKRHQRFCTGRFTALPSNPKTSARKLK